MFVYVKFVFGTKSNDAMTLVPMNYSTRTSICLLYCIRDSSEVIACFNNIGGVVCEQLLAVNVIISMLNMTVHIVTDIST